MSEIKAIRTRYNGYEFDSTLEARHAVFMDFCNERIRYTYGEHDGYPLKSGWYRPDYHLPDVDAWLEVKREGANLTEFDLRRIQEFGETVGSLILVRGDPIHVIKTQSWQTFPTQRTEQIIELLFHWDDNVEAAEFARRCRFWRGETPIPSRDRPIFSARYAGERAHVFERKNTPPEWPWAGPTETPLSVRQKITSAFTQALKWAQMSKHGPA